MACVELFLFGSHRVVLEGKTISRQLPAKGRALLAYLSVEGEMQRREKLAGMFWADQPDAQARQNLSQVLHALRECLGEDEYGQPYQLLTPATVQLNPNSSFWSDVAAFSGLLEECQQHHHADLATCDACFERQQQAAALYRGDFLTDFSLKDSQPFEEWSTIIRERFHRRALSLMHQLVESLEKRGDIETALEFSMRQVELEPLLEAGHRQVMRLLAASGRRSEALAHFNALQHLLQDSLGVEPDAMTREQHEQILNQAHQPQESRTLEIQLPVSLFPLIGRKAELKELETLLRDPDCRLLTLFGPGGAGKTRLALEAAQNVARDFPDGVYFISFSAYQPGSLPWVMLAEALQFPMREQQDPEKQVLDYLGGKKALLVLDGFEIAIDQTAWLSELLQRTQHLTVLVSSRARLEISAEQAFPLIGLEIPAADETEIADQSESVQLFLTFAHHRQPDFKLDEYTRPGVVHLCRLLQGLPLGLLLASAWVELYSPQEIADQIEHSLDFLEVTWSDMPPRQRSLRTTFDYSWNQLTSVEQSVLPALTVFQGSFSLRAAVEVAQAPARVLQSLVDKSMLSRESVGRYQLHDLLRQFAAQQLETNPELLRECHARHSRYYLQALADWEMGLKGPRQRQALETIDREAENLRAAWRWAVKTQDWQGIAEGLEGMSWYVDLRLRFEEGERACRTALENIPLLPYTHLVSALTTWRARFLRRMGQGQNAGHLLQAELARMKELQDQGCVMHLEQARVLYELGELNMYTDREMAKDFYQQSLALLDALGDEHGQALALASLGEAMHHSGPLDQAQVLLESGVELCRRLGDPRLLARCLLWNGWNHLRQGNLPQAEALIRESIEINHGIGDRYAEAFWGAELGTVKGWMGLLPEAMELISSSIIIYRELGLKQEMTLNILRRGLFAMNLMDMQQARQDFQDCLSNSYEINYQRGIGLGTYGMGGIALEEGDFQKAEESILKAFPILQGVQADEAGWCLAILVLVMRRMGQPARGWRYARQALELAIKAHVFHTAVITLLGIAILLIDEGQTERAIELNALATRYPLIKSSPWFYTNFTKVVDTAAASLPQEVIEAAQARGQKRDLFVTAAELLQEFHPIMEASAQQEPEELR